MTHNNSSEHSYIKYSTNLNTCNLIRHLQDNFPIMAKCVCEGNSHSTKKNPKHMLHLGGLFVLFIVQAFGLQSLIISDYL